MSSKSSDRTLVNVIGIPAWLGVIALGGIYYSLFMTVCIAIALWEFYQMAKTKDISPNFCGYFIHNTNHSILLVFSTCKPKYFLWYRYFGDCRFID